MPYRIDDELEMRFDTKNFPFEYKLLEWRLIINRQLYEEKTELERQIKKKINLKGK